MSFNDELTMHDKRAFRDAPGRKALLYVIGPDGVSYVPATAEMLGGGDTSQGITTTLPPQALTVSAAPVALTIPAGATHATVHVVSGSVRRSIGGVPGAGTPGLSVGDSEEISGAELAAYRLVRDGAADAQVYVEYRTVG
ncbi:hypothetical protein Dcar01_02405 [Deinococcus carri]|uniref:Uncharacterized protein n=1 Tax=Deinococcus carri TaxID=1211323 RepID=A0ABP9W8J0_9DEIO